jgi:hypothetical protein
MDRARQAAQLGQPPPARALERVERVQHVALAAGDADRGVSGGR